jgi:Transposase and inactivated derivatives
MCGNSNNYITAELVKYLDYYNNRRIKAKLKGLPPALHRQQALSAWKEYNMDRKKSAKGVQFMKRAVYNKEFKLSSVKLAGAGAVSVAETAKELGISGIVDHSWYLRLSRPMCKPSNGVE